MSDESGPSTPAGEEGVVVVVDAANVVGSRPDGWWNDRSGAAQRLLARLADLPGRHLDEGTVTGVVAVLEGRASAADDEPGVRVVRAAGSGDDEVVAVCGRTPARLVVVTADRGLRDRLPSTARAVGPRWLDSVLD